MANKSFQASDDISPQISQLYQEGATESPPTFLDKAILQRARIHCPAPATPTGLSWYRRWPWTMSTAASIAVVATILLLNTDNYQPYLPGFLPTPPSTLDDGSVTTPHIIGADIAEQDAAVEISTPSTPREPVPVVMEAQSTARPAGILQKRGSPLSVPAINQGSGTRTSSAKSVPPATPVAGARPLSDEIAVSRQLMELKKADQTVSPAPVAARLAEIDKLLELGDKASAVTRLRELHQQYPEHPLAERYRQLLVQADEAGPNAADNGEK